MNIKKVTDLINSIRNNDANNIKVKKRGAEVIINKIKIYKKNDSTKKSVSKLQKLVPKQVNKKKNDQTNKTEQSNIYSTIISPMVGTFYKSPAPNEPSFIEISDIVKPKQTVCIIEAMKLMNEIESEVSGEIVEILVQNGDIVDCGQALMKIKVK